MSSTACVLNESQEGNADDIVFEGSAEEAIRFLEGEQADETIQVLRAVSLFEVVSDH